MKKSNSKKIKSKSSSKKDAVFFGKKNQKKEIKKAEEMMKLYLKYIPQLKKVMREQEDDPFYEKKVGEYMYDFYEKVELQIENTFQTPMQVDGLGNLVVKPDNRQEIKPVTIMNELETIPNPFNCENLDKKISVLKDKTKLINQRYAKDQLNGLIKRLQNRKKYKKYFKFYNQFPNTTDDKIDKLLEKYKLVMKESHIFVPVFPDEAIQVMKDYTEVTKKVCGEKPVFYVIAEYKDFVKKEEKLDPILLVQSPFGFFWQILGAWDKEIILLHEL